MSVKRRDIIRHLKQYGFFKLRETQYSSISMEGAFLLGDIIHSLGSRLT